MNLGLKIFLVILTLVVIWFAVGMYGPSVTIDVSSDEKLWGGYTYQKDYILNQDVFLMYHGGGMAGDRFVIASEGDFVGENKARLISTPDSIESYQNNPAATQRQMMTHHEIYPYMDVRGIIKRGTKMQTYKLEKHLGYSIFFGHVKELTPYAKIINGEFAGTIVTIENVSVPYEENDIFKYRPEELLISDVDQ